MIVTPAAASVHLLPTDPAMTNCLQPTPILTLAKDPNNLQAGDTNLTFKALATLAPGMYTDTITLSVCLDSACVIPVAAVCR